MFLYMINTSDLVNNTRNCRKQPRGRFRRFGILDSIQQSVFQFLTRRTSLTIVNYSLDAEPVELTKNVNSVMVPHPSCKPFESAVMCAFQMYPIDRSVVKNQTPNLNLTWFFLIDHATEHEVR